MEAELKFEREKRSGVVAVGTYLFDAARRLGVEVEAECGRVGACDSCAMRVKEGNEFLSPVTERETEHLTAKRRANGERLSCQVKIEQSGEITVMTNKKKEEEKPKEKVQAEEYRKQFEELPLEKKVASLLELEAITLSETFYFVLNSPSHIVSKIMDVMAEFGLKLEEDDKKAKRPKEHKTGAKTKTAESAASGNGGKSKRQNKKAEPDENQE